jgi:hypothetical protein
LAPDTGAYHRQLAHRNERRLRPTLPPPPGGAWQPDALAEELAGETGDRLAEEVFVAAERRAVAPLLQDVPSAPDAFLSWFESLAQHGPGQNDALFPWLAERASSAQLRWFLGQEVAGEAGFEDLLALTQLKMPVGVKLEMARNYWDEMGRGRRAGMHGPMLARLAEGLGLATPVEDVVWESLALSNLMVALAYNRRYAYHAAGALGAIELTAPGRSAYVNAGLRRLQVPPNLRQYFALHATLDLQHARSWNREVLLPLAAAGPEVTRALAEGALLRLNAGARCFNRYRQELGLTPPAPEHA